MSRVRIARGASRAFTILLLGGAVQPAVAAAVPVLGSVWLALVAVTAFAAAARPAVSGPRPVRTGAAAALAGYALILPLSYVGTGSLPPGLVAGTGLTAMFVGGGSAWLSARVATRTTLAPIGEVAR